MHYNVSISQVESKSVIAKENTLTAEEVRELLIKHGADEDTLPEQISIGYRYISDKNAATVSKA